MATPNQLSLHRFAQGLQTILYQSAVATVLCCSGALAQGSAQPDTEQLRQLYSQPPSQWPAATVSDGARPAELAPLPAPPTPAKNMAALGEKLFNDTRLSRDHTVSCATCHESRLHFSDKRRMAVGIDGQVGPRNTQAIFAIDLWQSFFWDGRAPDAIHQALMPIQNPREMDTTIEEVLTRLNASKTYRQLFAEAFGRQENDDTAVDSTMLATAIVAFERTLSPPPSEYARFIERAYHDSEGAVALLSDPQLRGLHLFRTKAKCMTCHEGPLLSDNQFHSTGLHYYGRRYQDLGRYQATGKVKDAGKFRTPSLLGLNQTGPWMHNGLFTSLRGIVNLYDAGGARPKPRPPFENAPLFPKTTDLLEELALTGAEKDDLVAFLKAL